MIALRCAFVACAIGLAVWFALALRGAPAGSFPVGSGTVHQIALPAPVDGPYSHSAAAQLGLCSANVGNVENARVTPGGLVIVSCRGETDESFFQLQGMR